MRISEIIRQKYDTKIHTYIFYIISVILIKPSITKGRSLIFIFGITIFIYIWFILMTKMNVYFFLTLIFILFILYICIQYYSYKKLSDEDKKEYNIITTTIFVLSIVITVIGFLLYYGEKKYEYKKMFSWNDFFFNTIKCNFNPPKGTMKDYFLAIFNKNNI
jgi:Ca2+/Na+ antiporter